MKNKFSFVFVYWWIFVLFVAGSALAVFAEKEERVSETEKRMLSGFPEMSVESLASGDFFTGFESYLSDGMFGRDKIVGLSNEMIGFFSVNTNEDIELLDDLRMSEELQGIYDDSSDAADDSKPSDQESASVADDEAQTDNGIENSDAENTDGSDSSAEESDTIDDYGMWLKKSNGKFLLLLKAYEGNTEKVADILNQYKQELPEDGNVFYCQVPFSNTSKHLTEGNKYIGWYDNAGELLEKYINDGVYYIDAANIIESSILNGERMYYRIDHHWTPRAAVKAVNRCMEIQGIPAIPFEEYDYKINVFVNSSSHTQDYDLELLYPLQDAVGNTMIKGEKAMKSSLISYTDRTYSAFISGDTHYWQKFETGFSVGRNALVIGDSFSNAFTAYLMPYYDEVNKADIRHFNPKGMNISDIIRENDIDDVYVVVSLGNGLGSMNSYNRLGSILYGE